MGWPWTPGNQLTALRGLAGAVVILAQIERLSLALPSEGVAALDARCTPS